MEQSLTPSEKYSHLLALLRQSGSAALAFSGGVDSSFLLKAMKTSGMTLLAVTAISETMPKRDRESCTSLVRAIGAEQLVINTDELSNESFVKNTPERCFFCKDALFRKLKEIAGGRGLRFVFDGSNADDTADYRPGRRAAALHCIRSPLAECGLTKKEIRELSREIGLPTWDRPSSPCLSSRIPYGRRITLEALIRIEKAEEIIRSLGVNEVRVRDHGDSARIEVGERDMPALMTSSNRGSITAQLRSLGYHFISLDLEGFRSGSMNRVLEDHESETPAPDILSGNADG
jgi:uncharacterized protein